ncbi:MAG TPA: LysE family translocator [Burkholderiaceae bacterium]|nr:LysE family translocator [Burkholderiaceae bacterium]
MLSYEVALSFFGIAVLLALSPGPDNLFVLMQSALWGRASGMLVVLGLCTGLIFHTVAVAVGLAAVFATSAVAFTALKLAGALYLLYLAWGAFKAPVETAAAPATGASVTPASSAKQLQQSAGSLYRRGIVMNLTNPKVSLFFLAFLPQFTSPARGSVALQTLSLGALFILATLLVFGVIAWFSGAIGERMQRSHRAQRILNWVAGTVFLGLALKLAFMGRQ